jgi:hypothetical protein
MARRKKGVGSVEKDMGRSTVNYRPAKRRRSQQPVRFSNYVFKVLKQVHPQVSLLCFCFVFKFPCYCFLN